MTTLSATDAALEGFRLTREDPRTFLIWSAFSFLASIIGGLLFVALGQEAQAAYDVISGMQSPNPTALFEAFGVLAPVMVLGLLVQCITVAAVYRIVLRHGDHGFGYLKFGMDELRLVALTLIYMVIATAILFLVLLASLIVAGLFWAVAQQLAVLVGLGVEIFALGLLAYVGVRLSLAPAITFAEKRLAIFDSWAITKGHGWRLGGAYLLALACMMVIGLLFLTLVGALAAISVGGDLAKAGGLLKPDQSSFGAYLKPWTILYLALGAPLSALWYAVIAAPAAVAYRELSPHPVTDPITDE